VKRFFISLVAVVVLAAAAVGGYLYHRVTALDHQQITDDLYLITGFGGNVAALRTEAGSVLVDSMTFAIQGRHIRELAERLTGQPVAIVINTHYHQDHTHGNPGMKPGTKVVATDRTLHWLEERDPDYWTGDAMAFLPNETFEHEHVIEIGGKTIRLHHIGPAHTDGDLVVEFVEDRTIHTGDLLFNGRYPNIDLEAGGSVKAWPHALERVLELDFDHVIPGHGPLTDRNGIRHFRAFLKDLARVAQIAADRNWTLEQTLAETQLTENEGIEDFVVIPGYIQFDRDFVLRRAWEEATGAVPRPPGSLPLPPEAR